MLLIGTSKNRITLHHSYVSLKEIEVRSSDFCGVTFTHVSAQLLKKRKKMPIIKSMHGKNEIT